MSVFMNMPEYRIIVFSTSKEAASLEDNELENAVDTLKRYMAKETREVKGGHKELNESMLVVKDQQDKMEA